MELNDLQIATNIKNGDTQTYEYIVDKYSKQVYYLAYNILHISCTKEDIEECSADVFAQAWIGIDKYSPERASFKTWLFILTKYQALKYKRKISKEKTVNIDEVLMPNHDDVEKQFIARQDQEKVIDIINEFNEVDKELFLRRYFYGEGIVELMDSLNLTRSAVDNRLSRGRKLIKEVLLYE